MIGTDWMSDAVCTSVDPELFFVDTPGIPGKRQAEAAAAICHTCPVILQCRGYAKAIGATHGVWGGEHKQGKQSFDAIFIHGTEAGYKSHYRRGERPCSSCVRAASVAKADRDARRGA